MMMLIFGACTVGNVAFHDIFTYINVVEIDTRNAKAEPTRKLYGLR